ncbi:MAG: pirin family protein [Flavobacteriaceae bacterium]
MSNIGLIIEERSRDIGDFLVGRLLPFRKKRMVGPFIFIDHMGPTQLGPNSYMDVDQHPHTGLSTLTFMLQGEIVHRDSLGSNQKITPGSVNWMVAGKGVTHTERTPKELRNGNTFIAHGYQIWVALPKDLEDCEPKFHHIEEINLPKWHEGSAYFKLIAGEGYGRKSPVPVKSELFMIEVKTDEAFQLSTKDKLKGEIGVCIVEGSIEAFGEPIEKGNMLVSKVKDVCNLKVKPNSHLLLFGGKPFEEERFIYWNFVSSSKEKLEKAKEDWRDKAFPIVLNDTTYVKMPEY